MATFPVWNDWRSMARDVRRAFSKLTVSQNVSKTEFLAREWTPKIEVGAGATFSNIVIDYARYWKVRNKVYYTVRFSLEWTDTELLTFYMSLPFPAVSGVTSAYGPAIADPRWSGGWHRVRYAEGITLRW